MNVGMMELILTIIMILYFRLLPHSSDQSGEKRRECPDEVSPDQQWPLKKRIGIAAPALIPTVRVKVVPELSSEWEVVGASGQTLKIPYQAGLAISKVFSCELCKAHFPSKYLLDKHCTEGHPRPTLLQQKKFLEKTDIISYEGYHKLTSSGKFICNLCPHTAIYQAAMKKHVAQKHGDDQKKDSASKQENDSNPGGEIKYQWIHRAKPTNDDEDAWPREVLKVVFKEDQHPVDETSILRKILEDESDELLRVCPYCHYKTTKCAPFRKHVKYQHPGDWLKNDLESLVKVEPTDEYEVETERVHEEARVDHDCQEEHVQDQEMKEVGVGTSVTMADIDGSIEPLPRENYKCPYCALEVANRSAMISHVACVHHKSEWRKKAPNNRSRNLEHSGFACYHCDFIGCTLKSLNKHGLRKHEKLNMIVGEIPVTSFDCDICSYQCGGRKAMQKHIESHKPKPDEDGIFRCNICDFDTNLIEVLGRHISLSHLRPQVPVAAEILTCDQCNYSCINSKVMDWHRKQHDLSPEDACQMLICDECGYFSWNKKSLARHIVRKHREMFEGPDDDDEDDAIEDGNRKRPCKKNVRPPPIPVTCELCGYLARNNSVLKYHIIRKHTDARDYECEFCGKRYNLKPDLTSHIKYKHSNTGSYVCDVCGQVCKNSNGLYVHQKYAHFKTEFECKICRRRLASQANLDDHIIKQHEQRQIYICEECGKIFQEARRLRTHMRVHTGDRPYVCHICTKGFGKQTGLRQHLLTHSGQRPYVCDICGKAFTQKTGLICHRKSHPGPLPPLPALPKVVIDRILDGMKGVME